MEVPLTHLPPGDPRLVDAIVGHLKTRGIFDKFRKECLADVDTKPAFQNLRQRVDGQVKKYLETKTWKADLNKNQLRDGVRKNILDSGILDTGIDAIINQVVNPKIKPLILPYVEDTVYSFLNLEKPKRDVNEVYDRIHQQTQAHAQPPGPIYPPEPHYPPPHQHSEPLPPPPQHAPPHRPPEPVLPPPHLPPEPLHPPIHPQHPQMHHAGAPLSHESHQYLQKGPLLPPPGNFYHRDGPPKIPYPPPDPYSVPFHNPPQQPPPPPALHSFQHPYSPYERYPPGVVGPMEVDHPPLDSIRKVLHDESSLGADTVSSKEDRSLSDIASKTFSSGESKNDKVEEDNAVDSFDAAIMEAEGVTNAVQKMKIVEDSIIDRTLSSSGMEKNPKPTTLLYEQQSLDSISSNSSLLSSSPTSKNKASNILKDSLDELSNKSLEEIRSSQSTPLVDEKSPQGQSPPSSDGSKNWKPYTLPKDLASTERSGTTTVPVVLGTSPVSADSQDSIGLGTDRERSSSSHNQYKRKSDKSEGEVSSSTGDSLSPKYTKNEPSHEESSNSSGRERSNRGSEKDYRSREEKDRRHRDKDHKQSRHDDHSSHRDKNRKHHRRDKDDDSQKDRRSSSSSHYHHHLSSSGAHVSSSSKSGETDSKDRDRNKSHHSSSHSRSSHKSSKEHEREKRPSSNKHSSKSSDKENSKPIGDIKETKKRDSKDSKKEDSSKNVTNKEPKPRKDDANKRTESRTNSDAKKSQSHRSQTTKDSKSTDKKVERDKREDTAGNKPKETDKVKGKSEKKEISNTVPDKDVNANTTKCPSKEKLLKKEGAKPQIEQANKKEKPRKIVSLDEVDFFGSQKSNMRKTGNLAKKDTESSDKSSTENKDKSLQKLTVEKNIDSKKTQKTKDAMLKSRAIIDSSCSDDSESETSSKKTLQTHLKKKRESSSSSENDSEIEGKSKLKSRSAVKKRKSSAVDGNKSDLSENVNLKKTRKKPLLMPVKKVESSDSESSSCSDDDDKPLISLNLSSLKGKTVFKKAKSTQESQFGKTDQDKKGSRQSVVLHKRPTRANNPNNVKEVLIPLTFTAQESPARNFEVDGYYSSGEEVLLALNLRRTSPSIKRKAKKEANQTSNAKTLNSSKESLLNEGSRANRIVIAELMPEPSLFTSDDDSCDSEFEGFEFTDQSDFEGFSDNHDIVELDNMVEIEEASVSSFSGSDFEGFEITDQKYKADQQLRDFMETIDFDLSIDDFYEKSSDEEVEVCQTVFAMKAPPPSESSVSECHISSAPPSPSSESIQDSLDEFPNGPRKRNLSSSSDEPLSKKSWIVRSNTPEFTNKKTRVGTVKTLSIRSYSLPTPEEDCNDTTKEYDDLDIIEREASYSPLSPSSDSSEEVKSKNILKANILSTVQIEDNS